MITLNNRSITYDDLRKMQVENSGTDIVDSTLDKITSSDRTIHSKSWQTNSVRISSSVIAASASYMSMFYTYSWFSLRLGWIQALCMTVIIVGAILVIPQMIKLNIDKKGWKNYSASIMLSIILSVSALFSMMTTIGTLYNAQSVQSIKSSQDIQNKTSIQAGVESRTSRRKRYEEASLRASRDEERYAARIDAILSSGGDPASREMITLVANRNKAQSMRKEAETEIDKLIREEEAYSEKASSIVAERPDFITWIAGRFGVNRDNAELVMNAIPALFVDILAPSMLMVALFL